MRLRRSKTRFCFVASHQRVTRPIAAYSIVSKDLAISVVLYAMRTPAFESCCLYSPAPFTLTPMSRPAPGPAWREPKDDVYARLSPGELSWQARQLFLQSHGYMLRPRHRHPDMVEIS
ncbi:hypothetical protein FKP32DRAFT_720745 [Trametes sanguinea]|nr:hypothetical protein FKP32DRAFT_720745 [Trametes sanguinea]